MHGENIGEVTKLQAKKSEANKDTMGDQVHWFTAAAFLARPE